jgi:hypothetical protein
MGSCSVRNVFGGLAMALQKQKTRKARLMRVIGCGRPKALTTKGVKSFRP